MKPTRWNKYVGRDYMPLSRRTANWISCRLRDNPRSKDWIARWLVKMIRWFEMIHEEILYGHIFTKRRDAGQYHRSAGGTDCHDSTRIRR